MQVELVELVELVASSVAVGLAVQIVPPVLDMAVVAVKCRDMPADDSPVYPVVWYQNTVGALLQGMLAAAAYYWRKAAVAVKIAQVVDRIDRAGKVDKAAQEIEIAPEVWVCYSHWHTGLAEVSVVLAAPFYPHLRVNLEWLAPLPQTSQSCQSSFVQMEEYWKATKEQRWEQEYHSWDILAPPAAANCRKYYNACYASPNKLVGHAIRFSRSAVYCYYST